MASKHRYFNTPPVPLMKQRLALLTQYPGSFCTTSRNVLRWNGKAKPNPLSKEYSIHIVFKLLMRPSVKIKDPDNIFPGCKHPPHVFHVDEEKGEAEICLYLGAYEFNSKMYLASTIVPWAIEWLYFYEIWLATGSWEGGGHTSPTDVKTDD